MASGPVVNQGKTKFVNEFLARHGDAKRPVINEAWQAAGHEGEISESLVYKLRSQHGLTGGTSAAVKSTAEDPDSTAEGKKSPSKNQVESVSAEKQPAPADEAQTNGAVPSKSAFVEEMLKRDPRANSKAVNQAWSAAGHEGVISDPTFYKVKGRLAASSEPVNSPPTEPRLSQAPKTTGMNDKTPPAATSKSSASKDAGQVVDEVEAGIDDLMYKLKDSGGMPEVEAALRAARRLLVRTSEN